MNPRSNLFFRSWNFIDKQDDGLGVKVLDCLQELRLLVYHLSHYFSLPVDRTIGTSSQAAHLFSFSCGLLLGVGGLPCQ